jgi:probable DNA repair protein
VQVLEAPARAPLGRPAKVACADPDAELEAAARWARNRLERNPADRLLIAIADLERRRELVERTFSEVLEPNALLVSAPRGGSTFALEESVSLDRYPLVATALTALELAAERVPFDTASQWLRSPYWLSGTSRAASRAQLDALLRRVSAPELDLSALLDALAHRSLCAEESMSVALRRFAEELRKGRLAPADWSATFSRALNVIGWPGDRPLDSAEFQTVDKFHEALRTLATLDRLLGRVDLASAVRTLRHLVEQIAFQPESGDTPVRITSRIGDPVVTYDGIWVSGLHAGAWPESPRPDPFIPWRVQATVGLPGATARGVLQRARHTLSNWVAGATEVIVSWPVRLNEESCDPSPLIAAFPDFAWPDEKRPRYSELIHEAARRERLVDENAPPLRPGAKVRGGARALRLQSQCPFRATAEQRFGAQPLEQPEPGIDARTRGQLVHRALEQIWSTLGGLDGLLGRSVEERAMTVNAAADAASRGVLERGRRFSAAVRAIEAERLRELLRQWLALETGRGPFRVIGIEQVFDCSIAGLAFRLRVDRIDQLADGRQVLIDYKSGEADTKDWLGERPDDPQLPLYAQVLEEAPGALAYAMLSTDGCRFAGVSSVPPAIGGLAPERDWPTLLAQWRSTIERLASEVVAGRAAVDPLRTACSTCHLHALCRIDEVRRRSSQESPSE